jgi:hypothetical protein
MFFVNCIFTLVSCFTIAGGSELLTDRQILTHA